MPVTGTKMVSSPVPVPIPTPFVVSGVGADIGLKSRICAGAGYRHHTAGAGLKTRIGAGAGWNHGFGAGYRHHTAGAGADIGPGDSGCGLNVIFTN